MRMNAKLDILTRLQAAKTPRRHAPSLSPSSEVTMSPGYDDSDAEDMSDVDEEGDDETEREGTRSREGDQEEEEEEGDSGLVEHMLLADQRGLARVSALLASSSQLCTRR